MSYEAIARRWARAVFELGKDGKNLPALGGDIATFAELYSGSTELSDVLDNPLVPEASREAILTDLADRLSLSETARGTLLLLARKRRLFALPEIARQLARLVDEDNNLIRAEVTSAGPVSAAYLERLRAELEKATGKSVVITHKQDKALIGGVVTRIGDRVIDGSVQSRLASFREQLLRT